MTEHIPIDLADRIECYLNDHPGDGGHSDAAGGNCWELLDEAMTELRSMVPKQHPRCSKCGFRHDPKWESCSDRLPQCVHEKCDDPEWCTGESKCRYGVVKKEEYFVEGGWYTKDELFDEIVRALTSYSFEAPK